MRKLLFTTLILIMFYGCGDIKEISDGITGKDSDTEFIQNDPTSDADTEKNTVHLILPESIHIISGDTLRVYYDNIVLVDDIGEHRFDVSVDGAAISGQSTEYFEYQPAETGDYYLTVTVDEKINRTSVVHVIDAPSLSQADVLIIGDSLTSNGIYTKYLGDRIASLGLNEINFIGTVSSYGYQYEGHGGNTWERYLSYFPGYNPFYFEDTGLDFDRYFDEKLNGDRPEYAIIMLGVNDIFNTDSSDIQSRSMEIFSQADQFINALQISVPNVKILIASIVVPNRRAESFIDTYGDTRPRSEYRQKQHIFVQLQQQYFSDRENEEIYFFSTYYGLDSMEGFPVDNALHPSEHGYSQIADIFFNEFLCVLAGN